MKMRMGGRQHHLPPAGVERGGAARWPLRTINWSSAKNRSFYLQVGGAKAEEGRSHGGRKRRRGGRKQEEERDRERETELEGEGEEKEREPDQRYGSVFDLEPELHSSHAGRFEGVEPSTTAEGSGGRTTGWRSRSSRSRHTGFSCSVWVTVSRILLNLIHPP